LTESFAEESPEQIASHNDSLIETNDKAQKAPIAHGKKGAYEL
jgi:hypothetical protein